MRTLPVPSGEPVCQVGLEGEASRTPWLRGPLAASLYAFQGQLILLVRPYRDGPRPSVNQAHKMTVARVAGIGHKYFVARINQHPQQQQEGARCASCDND